MVKIGHPSISSAFEPPSPDYRTTRLPSKSTSNIIEEYFNGDWRKGHEIQRVIITQRLYQTSPNSTQA